MLHAYAVSVKNYIFVHDFIHLESAILDLLQQNFSINSQALLFFPSVLIQHFIEIFLIWLIFFHLYSFINVWRFSYSAISYREKNRRANTVLNFFVNILSFHRRKDVRRNDNAREKREIPSQEEEPDTEHERDEKENVHPESESSEPDQNYIIGRGLVTYYIKWVTTSWAYSMYISQNTNLVSRIPCKAFNLVPIASIEQN